MDLKKGEMEGLNRIVRVRRRYRGGVWVGGDGILSASFSLYTTAQT
jgi:hypothetical protein